MEAWEGLEMLPEEETPGDDTQADERKFFRGRQMHVCSGESLRGHSKCREENL